MFFQLQLSGPDEDNNMCLKRRIDIDLLGNCSMSWDA